MKLFELMKMLEDIALTDENMDAEVLVNANDSSYLTDVYVDTDPYADNSVVVRLV
jgi:hypothetical protein